MATVLDSVRAFFAPAPQAPQAAPAYVIDRETPADVMYEKNMYPLPISLSIGDEVLIEGTGAYTTTYSAVAFNGFDPLKAYVI